LATLGAWCTPVSDEIFVLAEIEEHAVAIKAPFIVGSLSTNALDMPSASAPARSTPTEIKGNDWNSSSSTPWMSLNTDTCVLSYPPWWAAAVVVDDASLRAKTTADTGDHL
jgi:hypothetical protein